MGYIGLGIILIGAIILFIDQNTDDAKIHQRINDANFAIESLKKAHDSQLKTITEVKRECEIAQARAGDVQTDLELAQEHMAKLRKSQLILRNKIIPKKVIVTHRGAIPVEVMGPSKAEAKPAAPTPVDKKALFKKLDKQLKAVSK